MISADLLAKMLRKSAEFFLFLFLLNTPMANSIEKLQTDLPLKYLSKVSAQSKDKPLIIFVHGYGTNEEDLFKMNKDFNPDYTYLAVRAPLPLYAGSFQWFSLQMPKGGFNQIAKEIKDSTKLLEDFIKAAASKYQTSAQKIILIGFSQGAIMSYEVALRNPTAVRGIIALSGAMLPTLQMQITPGYDLKNLAVFIGHGTSDNRVPFSAGTSANETLSKTSIKPEFHSYQGLGHSINQTELNDINEWIRKTL